MLDYNCTVYFNKFRLTKRLIFFREIITKNQFLVALENDKSRFLNKPSTIGPYVKTNSAYVKSLSKGFRRYVCTKFAVKGLEFDFEVDFKCF